AVAAMKVMIKSRSMCISLRSGTPERSMGASPYSMAGEPAARLKAMNDSLPWRFHAARALARHLPPFIAPLVTSRVYGFEQARGIAASAWAQSVTGSRARWPLGELHGWFQAV